MFLIPTVQVRKKSLKGVYSYLLLYMMLEHYFNLFLDVQER